MLAFQLLGYMKKTFTDGRIKARTPIDLVRWVIAHLKSQNMDKMFSGLLHKKQWQ